MCISSQNPLDVNREYFPANTRIAVDGAIAGAAEVTVAGDFSITYHKHFKVVKNLKTDPVKTYILRICGSDAPTQYPDGTAIEAGAKHFSVPVKGAALGWSTPVAYFEQLDLLDKVKLVDASYAHSPCLHSAKVAGDITQEGSANWESKTASETSVELVVASGSSYDCNCDKDVEFSSPSDDTPLGRAEWIKYLATFFNEEDRANLVFSREKAAYDATKQIATDAAALHEVTKAKKKCAWIGLAYNSDYSDSYWILEKTAYKLKYCTDAGMQPVTDLDGSGVPKKYVKSSTDLNTALADVDVIIDTSYGDEDPATNLNTKAKVLTALGLSSIKDGAVLLRVDRELYDTGSNSYNWAWVESAVIRPAHVLQGLVHAVWPNSVKEIPTACVDYFRDITAAGGAEAVKIVDHNHCTKWDNANAESQCITNILSDDEMAAFRMSPAAKPSFIAAIVVALVVAFIGA